MEYRQKLHLFSPCICRYTLKRHAIPGNRAISAREGGCVDRVFFFGGIAGVVGGFSVMIYQGIMFLKSGVWTSFSASSVIDRGPATLGAVVSAYPWLMNALHSCPMSVALIVIGLVLFQVSSMLRNRYA